MTDKIKADGNDTSGEVFGYMIERRWSSGKLSGQYLNIREGTWRTSIYATMFDTIDAAEAYAEEFCLELGKHAEIVRHSF